MIFFSSLSPSPRGPSWRRTPTRTTSSASMSSKRYIREFLFVWWEIIHFVCFMFDFCFYFPVISRCWSGQTWSRRWAYDSSAKRRRKKEIPRHAKFPFFSRHQNPYTQRAIMWRWRGHFYAPLFVSILGGEVREKFLGCEEVVMPKFRLAQKN